MKYFAASLHLSNSVLVHVYNAPVMQHHSPFSNLLNQYILVYCPIQSLSGSVPCHQIPWCSTVRQSVCHWVHHPPIINIAMSIANATNIAFLQRGEVEYQLNITNPLSASSLANMF